MHHTRKFSRGILLQKLRYSKMPWPKSARCSPIGNAQVRHIGFDKRSKCVSFPHLSDQVINELLPKIH